MPGNLTENNEMRKFKFYMFIHIIQMLFFFELLKVRMASRDFKLNFLLNNELTWIVNDLSAFKCLIWMKFNIVDIMYIEKSLHLRNCLRKNVGKQLKVIQMKSLWEAFSDSGDQLASISLCRWLLKDFLDFFISVLIFSFSYELT